MQPLRRDPEARGDSGERDGLLPWLPALTMLRRPGSARMWVARMAAARERRRERRSPECTRFSPVNGSHFAPASLYFAAICLRGSSADPFVSSSDDASELSGLWYVLYSRHDPSQAFPQGLGDGKQRTQRRTWADALPPAAYTLFRGAAGGDVIA